MNSRFTATATPVAGLWQIERQPLSDNRGFFERLFCAEELQQWGHPGVIAQVNRSLTRKIGAIRGMHFQLPPHSEWKVISCLRGQVYDVIVDLRSNSASFLRHFTITLSAECNYSLLVPPGCAHGFQTLTHDCEMLYFHSHPHMPAADAGLQVDDPKLDIHWPLPFTDRSMRDTLHPLIPDDYTGLTL